MNLFVPGLVNLQRNSKFICSVLNNNFPYIQVFFLFLLQKDSYCVNDDTDVCFIFILQKDFDIFHGLLI